MPIDPLKPYGLETEEREEHHHPWYAHWWVIFLLIVLGIVVVGGGYFGWQVYSYYKKVQSGEIAPAVYQLSEKFTVSGQQTEQGAVIPFFDVITADDPQSGPADALVTIIEFADFLCPFCAEEALHIRSIASKYPNEVRFIFRDFPLEEMHPGAAQIHIAGECANEQDKFWAFHDRIFQNQENISSENIKAYAAQAGLNISEFDACLDSGKYAQEVADDLAEGRRAGVLGTPTFFINGRKIEGAIQQQDWETLIGLILQASE